MCSRSMPHNAEPRQWIGQYYTERGEEEQARRLYGDERVDACCRAEGWDPDVARGTDPLEAALDATINALGLTPLPEWKVCDHCHGEGEVQVNAVRFLHCAGLDERDVRIVECGACDGKGRVPRDTPVGLPVSVEDFTAGLIPGSEGPTDVPF